MSKLRLLAVLAAAFGVVALLRRRATSFRDSKSPWASGDISLSSQGRLWTPTHHRTYSGRRKFADYDYSKKNSLYPSLGKSCEKWAVVTTIFEPTKLARQLDSMSSWCAVFVGDEKSPPTSVWRTAFPPQTSNVVFLDVQDQLELPYEIVKHTPLNHFSRKNLGLVYAIHHGAQVIYDTDDDNELLVTERSLDWWATKLLSKDDCSAYVSEWKSDFHVVNPYDEMNPVKKNDGEKEFVWPRGFPISFIKTRRAYRPSSSSGGGGDGFECSKIGVLQSLANHDPDVDALYRLTRTLPLKFDVKSVAYAVPRNALSPWNAQATLWNLNAFWGTLLPRTVHGRVSDIWRSYATTRLLTEVDLRLVFSSPFVDQFRNAHNYLADFESESDLYLKAEGVVRYLLESVEFKGSWHLPGRIEHLVICLYEIGALDSGDVELTQAFLSDLLKSGYDFPRITTPLSPRSVAKSEVVDGRREAS